MTKKRKVGILLFLLGADILSWSFGYWVFSIIWYDLEFLEIVYLVFKLSSIFLPATAMLGFGIYFYFIQKKVKLVSH